MDAGRIIGLIPARLASTRLPQKVLADIAGKPMIQHVVERARESRYLAEVIVATDSPEVAEVVRSFGGQVVMTSPHHASGTDRLAEAAQNLEAELIVNLQGDEPLLPAEVIDAAIAPFLEESELRLGTVAAPIRSWEEYQAPSVVKVVVDQQGFALYFSRWPIPYFRLDPGESVEENKAPVHPRSGVQPLRHIGLYVYTRETLLWMAGLPRTPLEITESLEQLRALEHGCPIRVVVVEEAPLGVDTPEDLERVRAIMRQRRSAERGEEARP